MGYAAQAAFTVCGTGADRFFEIYVYNALIFVAGGLCIGRAALTRQERGAWLVLGIGLLAWAAGEAYYSLFLDRLDSPPVPSVSDGLWLTFYPACYVAIVLLVRERVRQFRSSLWLDGVVGALAASAIAAALIFGTVVGGGENSSVIAVDLAYAIGDLLLLGFVVAVFGLTGWRPGRALLLVGAALVTSAIVDGWFLYTLATGQAVETTLVATLWPAVRAAARLCGVAAAGGGPADPARGLARPADAVGVCPVRPRAARLPHDRAPERLGAGAGGGDIGCRDRSHGRHVPREHRAARLQPPRSADRCAHGAAEQARSDRRPGGRGRGSPRGARRSRS